MLLNREKAARRYTFFNFRFNLAKIICSNASRRFFDIFAGNFDVLKRRFWPFLQEFIRLRPPRVVGNLPEVLNLHKILEICLQKSFSHYRLKMFDHNIIYDH